MPIVDNFGQENMDFYLLSSTLLITILIIIILSLLLLILNRKTAVRGRVRNPPQANGAWPIIGHLHLLGGSKLAHRVLGCMADKHGPIFTIKLGAHRALVVSNMEIVKECLTTNDKVFATRPKALASKLMSYNYAMFGLAPYGDYWREIRKIVKLEVLSQHQVEMLGHIRVSEVRASITDIYEAWETNKKSEKLNMVKYEMSRWFGNLVLNIIVRVISGKRFSPNDEEGVRFQMVVKKYFKLLGSFVVSDFIPYLKCFDVGKYEKAMKKTGADLDNILEGWLKDHKTRREFAHQHTGNQAFIDVLINILKGASEDKFHGFDHDIVIKSTCQNFLVAGVDTSSVTLTWALSLLLNNPQTLKIAQDELDEHVGRDRQVEESDMKNLVYLNAIIKETFRLYPAGPLSVPHESTEDCIVGGFNIPKGSRLLMNLWKMQRDPNVWSDPLEFRPERFLTDHKDVDVKGKQFELLPFGSGRRMCPGVSFSLPLLGLALATLIHQFTLKTPSNRPVDMTEAQAITNQKATPLEVLLAPRLSSNIYHAG